MKRLSTFLPFLVLFYIQTTGQGVGIGTNSPNSNAALDIAVSDKGLLIPRLTTTDRTTTLQPSLGLTEEGLIVFDTDLNAFYFWDGTQWVELSTSTDNDWQNAGTGDMSLGVQTDAVHIGEVNSSDSKVSITTDTSNTQTTGLRVNNSNPNTPSNPHTAIFLNNGNAAFPKTGIGNVIQINDLHNSDGVHTEIAGTGNGNHTGYTATMAVDGSGVHTGYTTELTSPGSGQKIGMFNDISGSSSLSYIGNENDVSSTGTGPAYGMRNELSGTGTGLRYGVHNTMSSGSTADQYGVYNVMSGSSTLQYGTRSEISVTTGQTAYGEYIDINSTGFGSSYGNYVTSSGNNFGPTFGNYVNIPEGSGNLIGTRNIITSSGVNTHMGVENILSGSASGDKYGTRNVISTTSGGTGYAVYGQAEGAGDYAGYFLGTVSIGTTTTNNYLMPATRGTLNQHMITDGSGNLSWANMPWIRNSFAGDVYLSNLSDHVGIGTITPDAPLEVSSTGLVIARVTSTNNVDPAVDFFRTGTSHRDWRIVNDGGNVLRIQSSLDIDNVSPVDEVNIMTTSTSFGGDVQPMVDNAYDVGSSSRRWRDIYATNSVIQTSDVRQKTNIEKLEYGLEEILAIEPVSFEWKGDESTEKKIGLIAQELQAVLPELVVTHGEVEEIDEKNEQVVLVERELDVYGIYLTDLIPVLVKAIQEQQELIEELQAEMK